MKSEAKIKNTLVGSDTLWIFYRYNVQVSRQERFLHLGLSSLSPGIPIPRIVRQSKVRAKCSTWQSLKEIVNDVSPGCWDICIAFTLVKYTRWSFFRWNARSWTAGRLWCTKRLLFCWGNVRLDIALIHRDCFLSEGQTYHHLILCWYICTPT